MLIVTIIRLVRKKSSNNTQKLTPFECGFNPISYRRLPFSIHFFIIAVIFLIFDIEIIIIIPIILTIKTSIIKYWLITSIMFLVILIVGLLHEWKNGIIEWTQ